MELPLVSVLTPSYNHQAFIGSCIESVLSQTYLNWEQIIIDDGSTDNTGEVVKQFQDRRIRYCRQENQGIENLARTYNRGLAEACGSLIAILEGDDLWPSGRLARMVGFFDDPEVVLAYGEALDVDATGAVSRRRPRVDRERARLPRSILFNAPVGSSTAYLLTQPGQSFITFATVLLRRSTLESIGGFQYIPRQCSPDIPTYVRLSVEGRFHYVPEVMGFRRRHLGSATLQNLSTMPQAARQYVLNACKDPALKLSWEDQGRIKKSWKYVLQISSFWQGRISLINEEWETARRQFISALQCLEARIMLGAGAGWILSWFHCDLEAIFRLAGRAPLALKKAPAAGSHARIGSRVNRSAS